MDTREVCGRRYLPRVVDEQLARCLSFAGAVVIEGVRASGKTMTALQAAGSVRLVDSPAVQELLDIAPEAVLEGDLPVLLDEWQLAPETWNMVRRAVDFSDSPGRFILTGSAVPADDVVRHTGAGRFLRLRQRTMTWFEKGCATGEPVSLAALFDGHAPSANLAERPSLDDVIENLLRPGFPGLIDTKLNNAAEWMRGFIDEVSRVDVFRLADIRCQPNVIRHLISALSRNVAAEVTYRALAADLAPVAPGIDERTVSNYVALLQRLFIVELQHSWSPRLRSRATVRRSPKFHLVDASLAAAAIGANQDRLRSDIHTLGFLFESAVIHDLTVFAAALGGEVRHYRDSYKREIDAVIMLPDGRWGAVEVKLGGKRAYDAIRSLSEALTHIDTEYVGKPTFRLVVTGNGHAFTAADGTITAPLSALAP